jgi:hypothetical protein
MSKRVVLLTCGLLFFSLGHTADKPGAFASSEKKLDYLLDTWIGQGLDDLTSVWGRASSNRPVGSNQVYAYERTSRSRAGFSILSGQVSVSTDDIVCTVSFEVDAGDEIVGVSRLGGGRDCWNQFKDFELPD